MSERLTARYAELRHLSHKVGYSSVTCNTVTRFADTTTDFAGDALPRYRSPGGEFPLQPPGPRPAGFPGCPGAAAPGPGNSPVHRAGCRPYGRSMHSAGGRAADADGERAETYLRLVAEAALRPAADGRADRVRNAADVLVDAGVLADTVAAQIIA